MAQHRAQQEILLSEQGDALYCRHGKKHKKQKIEVDLKF
jgi:hypothetical protein